MEAEVERPIDTKSYVDKEPNSSDDTMATSISSMKEKPLGEKTCCGVFDNNREALAWAVDVIPRGVIIMGNVVFAGPALLTLAKRAAGCQTELRPGQLVLEECLNTVKGIRPSSLLTTILTAVGLCTALLMPMIGAIIDHTKYRRAAGRWSALIMTIVTFLQIFISEETWFFIAILNVISAFFYIAHALVAMAYLPELTDDNKKLTKYTGNFTALQYAGMVIYIVGMVAVQQIASIKDEVQAASIAQAVSFVVSLVCFGYAWILFRARPASQKVPDHQFLVTAGFKKLWHTATTTVIKNVSIKWFLVSLACTEAAVSSFSTVAVTFMSEVLNFSSQENGIAILVLLIGTVPGALISTVAAERLNPVRSLQIALFIWILNTFLAALIIKGPGQNVALYIFSLIWGLATGWTYPMERTIYCTIIPKGQEAELMGVYLCTSTIIQWLPPLVFTAINEAGINMRVSIATLCFFFGISFIVLFIVGRDYDNAVEKVKRGSEVSTDVDSEEDIEDNVGTIQNEIELASPQDEKENL